MSLARLWFVGLALAASPRESVEVVVKGPPSKTLKGEVVRENLRGMVLKGEADTLAVAWTDIQTVNGRPTTERLAKVKEAFKDLFCPDCKGGLVTLLCPECLATGKVPRTKPCEKCGGSGTNGTPCTAKGCDKGKTDCPGPCLKRTVGVWKEFPGLGLSRIFHVKLGEGRQGTPAISTRHLGQVVDFKEVEPFPLITCPKCKGVAKTPCKDCKEAGTFVEKKPELRGDCLVCGGLGKGAGQADCTTCLGLGTLPCDACLGTKAVAIPDSARPCTACKDGVALCATCSETGIVDRKAPVPRAAGIPPYPPTLAYIQPTLRKIVAAVGEAPAPHVRATLRDGRSLEGTLLQRMYNGIILALPRAAAGEVRVLVIFSKYGVRYEEQAAPAVSVKPPEKPAPAPAPAPADPPAKPTPGPDTIVLKDGTTLNGKILGRSDQILMIKTTEGKVVKVEAEKVAEVRTEKK